MTQLEKRTESGAGSEWRIRIAVPADARKIVDYLREILLDRQSSIADQDEMVLDVMTEREHLRRILDNPLSTVFVAESDGQIIGFLTCECGRRRKIRHTAEIGMSVHREYRRQGIGTELLRVAESWAKETGRIRKLTLNVFATNGPAINLYRKNGFEYEGLLVDQICLDGLYLDLILMGKHLIG
ncbi:MAG TPA: GNAT family N-acetyltransferase [bacterium]|jgi:RimJ/RimL family protein N-acetyltransferase